MKTYWPNLSYFFLFPLFLLDSIALTVTNPFSACFIDFHVGRINPGTFGAALTTQCSAHSDALMPLHGSMSDSSSASHSTSLLFGLSNSPFQLSQFSVSEMLSGALSSSLSNGWQLIYQFRQTFNTLVCPPGRFFVDIAGGKGDLSDNLNAAAPSCCKFDEDALMISLVSEMYSTAVICLFEARDFFCVAHRFWLPCHISKKSWTLAILCHFLSSTSFFNSKSFSVSAVSNAAQLSTNILLWAWSNCLTTTFSLSVSPVVSANNILPKRKTGLHSDTMWYNREYVVSHIGEISVLWVCFLLLAQPVGDIW